MKKQIKKRNKSHHSPKTIRILEHLSRGRCQHCGEVSQVKYFCEKNLYFNKKIVEIILCESCLTKLIIEISESEDNMRKVFLPILKYMRGDKVEKVISEPKEVLN